MKNRWIVLIDKYDGITKNAINMLVGTLSGYLNYVLPVKFINDVTDEELTDSKIIAVGTSENHRLISLCEDRKLLATPKKDEGYSVFVGESILNPELQMIAVSGSDEKGILYGCMDFCNKYCGDILYREKDIWGNEIFTEPFEHKINTWQISLAPAIKRRAIWTWGHVIYDYRRFLDNMARLKLNEIVIWNDCAPLNANDVVKYAHSLGIKVIFGFTWGWGASCADILEDYNEKELSKLKAKVIRTYEEEYRDLDCDGIYFQSFTELDTDNINGKYIAELVTELVNDISGALLQKYPELHIQFGLHATSVKNRLDAISKVDKRVHIVWEDCGSFPYSYWAENVSNFEDTYSLTQKLLTLRGKEDNFGAVFKGMLKLDWNLFEHFESSYILGERTNDYISRRQIEKNRIWKILQADWLKNADLLRKTVELIAGNSEEAIIEALVEDSMFENKIMLPVAVYAETLWNPSLDTDSIIAQVSKYPAVNFANL